MDLTTVLPLLSFIAITTGLWSVISLFTRNRSRASERLEEWRDPFARQKRDAGANQSTMGAFLDKAAPTLSRALESKDQNQSCQPKVRAATAGTGLHELSRHAVDHHAMLPIHPLKGEFRRPDLRNHRKILVVDGHVGFMGSLNVIDRSYNKRSNIKRGLKWQELVTRVEGPVVDARKLIFITD